MRLLQIVAGFNLITATASAQDGGSEGSKRRGLGVAQANPLKREDLLVPGGGGYIIDVVDDDIVVEAKVRQAEVKVPQLKAWADKG